MDTNFRLSSIISTPVKVGRNVMFSFRAGGESVRTQQPKHQAKWKRHGSALEAVGAARAQLLVSTVC